MTDDTTIEYGVFDVSNWKPIPAAEFAEAMAEAFFVDEDGDLKVTLDELPNGLFRMVVHAELSLKKGPAEEWISERGPYLMTLYDYHQKFKTISFIRTDRELNR